MNERKKLTVEEFERLKDEAIRAFTEAESQLPEDLEPEEYAAWENEQIRQYVEFLRGLAAYDLSDIPMESWNSIQLYATEELPLDFSNTGAHLDFSQIYLDGDITKFNFKGCDVVNLDQARDAVDHRSFDPEVVAPIRERFISDIFDDDFIDKYYTRSLTIDDIAALSDEQLTELEKDAYVNYHFDDQDTRHYFSPDFIKGLGLRKFFELYKNNGDELKLIYDVIHATQLEYGYSANEMYDELKGVDTSSIKDVVYKYAINQMFFESNHLIIDPASFPEQFIEDNKELFLIGDDIPADLRERYYSRNLTFADVIYNARLFHNIELKRFISFYGYANHEKLINSIGLDGIEKLVAEHRDVMDIIVNDGYYSISDFASYLSAVYVQPDTLDRQFKLAVQKMLLDNRLITSTTAEDGTVTYSFPEWLTSYDFKVVPAIQTVEDLMNLDEDTIILDDYQRRIINALGIENIKKFEAETGFFSHGGNNIYDIDDDTYYLSNMFSAFTSYVAYRSNLDDRFRHGDVDYDVFRAMMANFLEEVRDLQLFDKTSNYDFITGKFREDFSGIFIETDNQQLRDDFYEGRITFSYIQEHPEVIPDLEKVDLRRLFGKKSTTARHLIEHYGNRAFLDLAVEYGSYLQQVEFSPEHDNLDMQGVRKELNEVLLEDILSSRLGYTENHYPPFLKEEHPELFLDPNAPQALKDMFYSGSISPATFTRLSNSEYREFIKGKDLMPALLRSAYDSYGLKKYLQIFGSKAIQLGLSRAETVEKMIASNNIDLMKKWYDATGGKFIPDYVVMESIPAEQVSSFLANGRSWSSLMSLKEYSTNPEYRRAMLKLAYSFGVFDTNSDGKVDEAREGFKAVYELLTRLPQRLENTEENTNFINVRMKNLFEAHRDGRLAFGLPAYRQLVEALKVEAPQIDLTKEIFPQIYRQREDGSFALTINSDRCKNSAKAIRQLFANEGIRSIITPDSLYRICESLPLTFTPGFREFFLEHLDAITSGQLGPSNLAAIDRSFRDIKIAYANKPLTLEAAISFVKENLYQDIREGNERTSRVAAAMNYDQSTFDVLQDIFDVARKRTHSSIPKVSGMSGKYVYRVLALDDPQAMVSGDEADCCQKINDCAEQCMEHSMTEGRLFEVRDSETGLLVAQSWMWRNGNVICFDNIEVPDQQMWDHGIPRGSEDEGIRNEFTDEVLECYKRAAADIKEEDRRVYGKLSAEGKITQEEYDRFVVKKITTGEGYSNIKGSLRETLETDRGTLAHPRDYTPPVPLSRSRTFYTSDSQSIQYIIDDDPERKQFLGEEPKVHSDEYVEYDDNNIDPVSILTLQKLAFLTDGNINSAIGSLGDKNTGSFSERLSRYYGLDPLSTKAIIHPNFAIIYDTVGEDVKIGDVLFNTQVGRGNEDISREVAIQVRLALEQIGKDKRIDSTEIDGKSKEMFDSAMQLSEEDFVERMGLNNGK